MLETQTWELSDSGFSIIKGEFIESPIDIKWCFPDTNYTITFNWGHTKISVATSKIKCPFIFELPRDNWLFNYISPKRKTSTRFNHYANFKRATFYHYERYKIIIYTADHQSSPPEELKKIIVFCLCMKYHVKYLPKFIRINIIDMYIS
jgi:hypothetical protein